MESVENGANMCIICLFDRFRGFFWKAARIGEFSFLLGLLLSGISGIFNAYTFLLANLLWTYNLSFSFFGVGVICNAQICNKWWAGTWSDSLCREVKAKIKII